MLLDRNSSINILKLSKFVTFLRLVLKNHLSLSIKNHNGKGKILHITDTHLFANENDTLLGVNTNKSFSSVINNIKKVNHDFDLIVATGDFVQDGSKEAYLRFINHINKLSIPCVWLPGNHDIYATMKMVFEQYNLPEKKVVLLGGKWLLILLNSQVLNKAYGFLSDSELKFLTSTVKQYPERHTMVFLHHHPVLTNCNWLDEHCLKNRLEFGEAIRQHNNIKSIAWGHIHQKIEQRWHQCQVFSTPSTCVQFKPLCNNFELANSSPGWRIIELDDSGQIYSTVHCLEFNSFLPDVTQTGY